MISQWESVYSNPTQSLILLQWLTYKWQFWFSTIEHIQSMCYDPACINYPTSLSSWYCFPASLIVLSSLFSHEIKAEISWLKNPILVWHLTCQSSSFLVTPFSAPLIYPGAWGCSYNLFHLVIMQVSVYWCPALFHMPGSFFFNVLRPTPTTLSALESLPE